MLKKINHKITGETMPFKVVMASQIQKKSSFEVTFGLGISIFSNFETSHFVQETVVRLFEPRYVF